MQAPWLRRLIKGRFRVADAWDQTILSNPAIVTRVICGKKGGAEIEALLFIHPAYFDTLRPARFPEILNPVKSGIRRNQSRQRFRVKNKTQRMTL